MLQLPEMFKERIRDQLGANAEAFLKSYNQPKTQGLRINPLKIGSPDDPIRDSLVRAFNLDPVPWCQTGYYYDHTLFHPGKHPYHAAGLYYIQEPSAMSVVELLNPQPGDVVLDLAAAPGGKSTHIAGKLQGQGLLIANEIHPSRAKIIAENIERMGIANTVVTCCSPDQLAHRFPLFFDKIILDAPCSGEGMFRKDSEAIIEWSPDHVTMCATRQMDIMRQAILMLKPGGLLAYSTCTFSEEENEDVIAAIVEEFPQLELQQMERIWPHLQRGEGHFAAILRNQDNVNIESIRSSSRRFDIPEKRKNPPKHVREAFGLYAAFAIDFIFDLDLGIGEPLLFGDQLYWLPHAPNCSFHEGYLQGIKVLRPGLHLGTVKKNRLEPAHALALALPKKGAVNEYSLSAASPEIINYLRGESIQSDNLNLSWMLISVNGFAVGWGKESNGQIKNHFPKGLRWLG